MRPLRGRVVGVSMSSGAIKRRAIRWVQGLILFDPLDQVRIGNKQATENDCIGVLLIDGLRRACGRVSGCREQRSVENRAKQGRVIRRIVVKFIGQTDF